MKINMTQLRYGYLPQVFSTGKTKHTVTHVERIWTTETGGRVNRYYFQILCAGGRFTIYQDLGDNTWHLEQ
jgi:hypothetical protein